LPEKQIRLMRVGSIWTCTPASVKMSLEVALDLGKQLLSICKHGLTVVDLIRWELKQRLAFLWGWMLKALMHFLISWILEKTVILAKCAEGNHNVCPHTPARPDIKDDISLWVQGIIKVIRKYSEEQGGDVSGGGGCQNRISLAPTDYKKKTTAIQFQMSFYIKTVKELINCTP